MRDPAAAKPTSLDYAQRFIERLGGAAKPRIPALALGDELEIASEGLVGAALLYNGDQSLEGNRLDAPHVGTNRLPAYCMDCPFSQTNCRQVSMMGELYSVGVVSIQVMIPHGNVQSAVGKAGVQSRATEKGG